MLEAILFVLYGVLLFVLVIGAWRLRFAFSHFKVHSSPTSSISDDTLPSVTVCIPARNETHAMTECLERLVASDYQKLEVIVLDDLSGDNTPVLIKSFAHAGIRFVEGTALPEGWLGKNHALQELLEEASGTYVLFMDVDTVVKPDSITKLVNYALSEKALMVSVLPRREDGWRGSVLFSPLRYFWEVVFHRRSAPSTASNAWLIHRQTLRDSFKGFGLFKSAIQPEANFSAKLMETNDYRFLIGTEGLGIGYEKKWRSQVETSIRLLFPLLGGRVEHGFAALFDLLIVFTPTLVVLGGFVFGFGLQQAIAGCLMLLFALLYGMYLKRVWKHGWLIGALLWPVIVLQEAVLVAISMIQYNRRAVTWKGRLVKTPRIL